MAAAGNEPKPFPPPMKICREMVDAMGGYESELYRRRAPPAASGASGGRPCRALQPASPLMRHWWRSSARTCAAEVAAWHAAGSWANVGNAPALGQHFRAWHQGFQARLWQPELAQLLVLGALPTGPGLPGSQPLPGQQTLIS